MANLQGEKKWSPVRVLETNELARGGLNGNMNEQAKALLDRTEWLNDEKANKSEIIQGHFSFNTLAAFNAKKATIPVNSTVIIAEAGANQGENIWDGTTLTKSSYDVLAQAKSFTNANPLFKPAAAGSTDLNTLLTPGFYIQSSTTANPLATLNYPVVATGVLIVSKMDRFGYVIQSYLTPATGVVYSRSYNGTTWAAWANTDYKSYVDANPNFKPVLLTAASDLNTITTYGTYYKIASGDIDAVTNHYPVALSGALKVTAYTTSNVLQEYTVWSTGDLYRRFLNSGVWSAWKTSAVTATDVDNKIAASSEINDIHYEWFLAGNNITATYDVVTKTLSWPANLIAPSKRFTLSRISIPAGSIVVDVTAIDYGVLFLDLTKVPANGTLTTDDIPLCLVYASYSGVYKGNKDFLPLAKKDKTRNAGVGLTPCPGFVPIRNSFESVNGGDPYKGRYLEWHPVATGTTVSFNPATKVLTWSGYILAAYSDGGNTKRIRLDPNITIQFANQYEIAYIDTAAMDSATKNITQADVGTVLKVGTYGNGWVYSASQIPIAKYYSLSNSVTAAAGFLPVNNLNGSSTSNTGSSGFFPFSKVAGNLDVYLPTSSGKRLKIGLMRQVFGADTSNAQSQSDMWRLNRATQCNPTTLAEEVNIVTSGEWECAITHVENTQVSGVAKDHVGGVHGDELQTYSMFFIDGVRQEQDFVNSNGTAREIVLVQVSTIYFQNTTTPFIKHSKAITFTSDGVRVKQSMEFLANAHLGTAWVAMLPILRTNTAGTLQITDHSARSNDFYVQTDDNTAVGFPLRYTPVVDGSIVRIWGNTSKYSAEVQLIKAPNWDARQNVFVQNTSGYNKIYYSAIDGANVGSSDGGAVVNAGTIWNVEAFYKINIAA